MEEFYSSKRPFLSKEEYAKIVSEINSVYFSTYAGHSDAIHFSVGTDNCYYAYYFENHGFDNYKFVGKVPF